MDFVFYYHIFLASRLRLAGAEVANIGELCTFPSVLSI